MKTKQLGNNTRLGRQTAQKLKFELWEFDIWIFSQIGIQDRFSFCADCR